MSVKYSQAPNKLVSAANGIDYAYRETGEGTVPLVLLQHFRGNLDNWDPALVDALAATRRVVAFDNAGVGGSTGTTPDTVEADGPRCYGLPHRHGCGPGRSARVLHRQLRRPGNRPGQASPHPEADTGLPSSAGRGRNARLGPGGHRGRRHARNQPRGIPRRVLHPLCREPGRPARRRCSACTPEPRTATRPRAGQTREAQYDAVCGGESRITRCSSGSALSKCRCSSPTATATR